MQIAETKRLILRVPETTDGKLVLELFNQRDCVRFIGDKNIKSLEDAENYITEKFLGLYRTYGFCLYIVEHKELNESVGICGLVKRESLEDADIGFAILTKFQGNGYVTEAAKAVKNYAFKTLGINRLVGITDKQNVASSRVLEKIGLVFEKNIQLEGETKEVKLYAATLCSE
ncbi:MAG: GNAT family N-acetyltransferase [Gammaproteobacteria bacterium]|nr:MAG: GNAT family N-acetyltransferase [Gammaproteobacteria bacterium]